MFWIANVFFYGFGEEVGWRGFALARLQARKSALTSALLISAAWAAWHLPLFTFAGGLSSMGIAGVAGWLFSIVTGSILMTWLFNASGGSVLAVALFHGALDIVMSSKVVGPLPSVMGASITIFGLAVPLRPKRTYAKHRLGVSKRRPVEWLPSRRRRPGAWLGSVPKNWVVEAGTWVTVGLAA